MDNKSYGTYSINYNKNNEPQKINKSYQAENTKSVIANSPTLKKYASQKNEFKRKNSGSNIKKVIDEKKSDHSINEDDICIKAKSSKKVLFYKILYCCFILLFSSLGIYAFSSMVFKDSPFIDVSSSYKSEYYKLLSPVVMNDPTPFDSPQNADVQMIIASSIWKLITEKGTQKYNQFDERGLSLIPTTDIIKASKELFGEDYNLNLDESIFGSFFTFYKGEENFHISAVSNQNSCIPYIKEFTEVGDSVILNVGYVSRDDKFLKSDSEKAEEPSPIKYMKYTLKKDNETAAYYIYSVENT